MSRSRIVIVPLLAALAAACTPQQPLPSPGLDVGAVRVAPTRNATGRELLLSADPGLDGVLGRSAATVPGRLDAELRWQLALRGFAVDAPGADALEVEITRWEPAAPTTDYVWVSVAARLTAPDGSVRWQTARNDWTVVAPSRGSDVLPTYAEATAMVARTLIDDWRAPAR